MKFLFKLIVLPILSIVAIPLIILALLYKPVSIPVDDFGDIQAVSLTEMIQEDVDSFLLANDVNSSIGLSLAQENANSLILNQMRTINANYLLDGATDDEKNYVLKEEYYGYQGSWVRFKDDVIEIESGAHIFVSSFTYQTRLLIAFKITADTDEIVLKLDKLTIGNLPLAWTFSVASWVTEQVAGQSIKELIDGQLNGLATFDATNREIRMSVDSVIDQMIEDDQQKAMIQSLLAFIEENELLDIGFEDENFDVDFALGKLKDATASFELQDADKIANDAELQSILAAKASAMIFSTLGGDDPTPFIELDDFTLNRVFEYFMRPNQTVPNVILSTVLFEKYTMTAFVPYVTMETNEVTTETNFVVNIPLTITETTDPLKIFQTIIKIDATPEVSGSDLRIVLNELDAGEVTLTSEHIANVLTMLGDNEIIENGAFVIKDFDQQMDAAGMGIESVALINNKLRMYVTLSETIPLQEIQDAVQDVLDQIAGDPSYPPELNDAINDLLTEVQDPSGDPAQAVEDLMTELDNLTDEEQEQLFEDLVTAFEGTGLTYEDLFGLIP
ncbi:MAG: hypothetical protein RBQ71_04600 [Acholeplasmataceae bacterium]|jgi:hypothetical protein|nr:hypothetical protein [Acholeplasmataceae bacterium]